MTNCTGYTAQGAQIIVLPGYALTLDSTVIEGCTFMWRGIRTETHSVLRMVNHSNVLDAEYGLYALNRSIFYVVDSRISDCVTGIFVPPHPDCVDMNVQGYMVGSRIGMYSSAFNTDYPGQAVHGDRPKAGMDLNDNVMTIGDYSQAPNEFHNLNTGITGYRSYLIIENTKFDTITVDSFYTEPYRGTAMVSVGDPETCKKPAGLIVYPVANQDTTVLNSFRGVYTDYSDLTVSGVTMFNLNTGIYSTQCTALLTTLVSGCTIYASRFGIHWKYNFGTGGMTAIDNSIYVTGQKSLGIYMLETSNVFTAPYRIVCNYVENIDGNGGIIGMNLRGPGIVQNTVRFLSHATNDMQGINISGCLQSRVTYNESRSVTNTDTSKVGIFVSISSISNVSCNTVDSTGKGVFFGGVCPNTNFKRNSMNDHYVGLYLNKVAVIDQQPAGQNPPWNGNTWLDTTHYVSGYRAVNLNADSASAILLSLFTTYQGTASYNPKIPLDTNSAPFYVDDQGWFSPQNTDSTYSCLSVTPCYDPDRGGEDDGSDELRQMIAGDNSLTSEFIPESKMIASQFLYEELKSDSMLLASDTVYQNFVDEKEDESIGYLHEAKKAFGEIGKFDSAEYVQLILADSIINNYIDSIYLLDSINIISPIINYSALRGNYIAQINFQQGVKQNILAQQNVSDYIQLNLAEDANNNASPTEMPDENEKFVNGMEIILHRDGADNLLQYYEQILAIAQQCPYSGGNAVYRSRAFISIFNDSEEYDDETNCLQQGIYRLTQSQNADQVQNDVLVKPNPADESAEIMLKGNFEGICKIIVEDFTGRVIYNGIFECSEKRKTITTRAFVPGVYHVKVFINDSLIKTAKLVIAR